MRVEGNPLEDYEDDEGVELGPNDDESYRANRIVSKYVETISDKEYTIKMQVDPVYTILSPTLGYRVIVDGQLIEVPVIQLSTKNPVGGHLKDPVSRNSIGRKVQDGQFGNRILLQKYRFAKIEITNDGIRDKEAKTDAEHVAQIGEICVEIYRMSECIEDKVARHKSNSLSGSINIHEKVLKGQAKSHSTK